MGHNGVLVGMGDVEERQRRRLVRGVPEEIQALRAGMREPAGRVALPDDLLADLVPRRAGKAPSGTGSDKPVPRMSKQITRPIVPSRMRKRASEGSSHMISILVGWSGTKTRPRGPSPNT